MLRYLKNTIGLCRGFSSGSSKNPVSSQAEGVDKDFDPVAYYKNRVKFLNDMKQQSINPYPHKFQVRLSVPDFISKYSYLTKGEKANDEVSIAGRVVNIRKYGKLMFFDILAEGVNLQIMADKKTYKEEFEDLNKIHRGDIVGAVGIPARSSPKGNDGELSILPWKVQILSHCLHMMPGHTGLKDMETRFRQRYLDLIMNPGNQNIFKIRAKVIQQVREFLISKNFLEVETPMMNMIPGGAAAKPFETFHEDLDMKLFMRIAPELYLKMLVVGGLEKVFEIGKQFRNESIDMTHNPEFTTCEFYWAYADYYDLMKITEELISGIVLSINGSYLITYSPDPSSNPVTIDFTPPFKRVSLISTLNKLLNTQLPDDLSSPSSIAMLDKLCHEHSVEIPLPRTPSHMLDKLCGKFIEPSCLHPTFIIDHPQIMSPLAKFHRNNKSLTERFELFVNFHEICNSYTELNDPIIQRELFEAQAIQKAQGDAEAQLIDENFCTSLEYGLPPTAGWGLGIDRLVMLLTNKSNIKEVLLFPAMKPQLNSK